MKCMCVRESAMEGGTKKMMVGGWRRRALGRRPSPDSEGEDEGEGGGRRATRG